MSFVIAKQPAFDKDNKIVAFEVYLRKKDRMYEYPKEVPYNRAAFIILEIISEHGLEKIGEGKRVIINLSIDSLINKTLSTLDPNKLIIELLPPQVHVGSVVLQNAAKVMDAMIKTGALFSVSWDLLHSTSLYQDIYNKAHFISVDINKLDNETILKSRSDNKKLIITRIETQKEYEKALKVGTLFEGNFLGKPIILKEFQIAPYLKSTLLKLMAIIHTVQSTKEVANIVSSDVGMSAKLLRVVNSAYFSPITEIKSIEQACAMLGLKNLKNFLMVFAMNDYMSVENPQLWKRSLIRAILAESLASLYSPNDADKAYLIGMFSLIDEILDMDKISFLKDINVSRDIIDGFTGANKILRLILDVTTILEENADSILSSEDTTSHKYLEHAEKQIGIDKAKLKSLLKNAVDKAELVLKL